MADDVPTAAETPALRKAKADAAAPTRPEAGTIVWGDENTNRGRVISVTKYDVDGATTFENLVKGADTADTVRARLANRAGVPVPSGDE